MGHFAQKWKAADDGPCKRTRGKPFSQTVFHHADQTDGQEDKTQRLAEAQAQSQARNRTLQQIKSLTQRWKEYPISCA